MNYKIKIEDFLLLEEHCNVFLCDRSSRIIACNQTQFEMFESMFGLKSIDDLIGRSPLELLLPHVAEALIAENNLVMSTGKTHQFMNFGNFGKSFVFAVIKTPLYDEHDEIVGIFGVSQYISVYDNVDGIAKPLTHREMDCLKLTLKGKTSAEISTELNLSKRTVEYYIENIKNKLGCDSRSDLFEKIYQIGIHAAAGDKYPVSQPFKPGEFISKITTSSVKKK